MIDSPTDRHWEAEEQATPNRGSGEVTVVAPFQGLAVGPVKSRTPEAGELVTVLPTATQVSSAIQETPKSSATEAGVGWLVQVAPPLEVVKTNPWPVRARFWALVEDPTTVHLTPATPAGSDDVVDGAVLVGAVGTVIWPLGAAPGTAPDWSAGPWTQETEFRKPEPAGIGRVVHEVPPFEVDTTEPAVEWPVTQQCWASTHETPLAPLVPPANIPAWVQVAPAEVDTRATSPEENDPMAMHRRSDPQVTVVTSPIPVGTVAGPQVAPPLLVTMAMPWLPCPWPTATHRDGVLQAMSAR